MKQAVQVTEGLEKGTLDTNWNINFTPKPIPSCCLFIINKNKEKNYFCIHYEDFSKFNYNNCDQSIKMWIFDINKAISRLTYYFDYVFLVPYELLE